MSFKNRLLMAGLLILFMSLLAIWFAPFAVSHSLRLWIWWKARDQKLTVKIDQIDAPFSRPVVVRGFRMTSAPDAAFQIDVSAVQATLNLNLKAILMRMDGRAIPRWRSQSMQAPTRSRSARWRSNSRATSRGNRPRPGPGGRSTSVRRLRAWKAAVFARVVSSRALMVFARPFAEPVGALNGPAGSVATSFAVPM